MKCKLRTDSFSGPHVHLTVYMGAGQYAHCGRLTMLAAEAAALTAALQTAAEYSGGMFEFEADHPSKVVA